MKKLCSILLTVCLVISLAPEIAFGASKITRKDGSALDKVYVGSKYTLVVKDKDVKFSSANTKIATFTKKGKLKPIAAGRVKITAKGVESGKAVATKVVTVLKRSEKVKADVKEIYLNVGETQTVKATLEPSDSSDYIHFKSSDKSVATVDSATGEITAKKNGEATITVYAKATKETKNSSENNRTTKVKVYVGPIMKEAKQLSVTVIELNFMTNMESYNLKPSAFNIINTETKGSVLVRGVSVSGKTVRLTTYNEIKDGMTYRVSYDTTSAKFTATDAKVKTLRIEPTQIDVKTATEIKVVLLDNDGVIVGSYNQTNKPGEVEFHIDTSDGFVSRGRLYLNTVNSKATAKAVYHTYIYQNGVETGVLSTGDVTITAVEPKEDEEKEEDKIPKYVPRSSPYYQVQYTVDEALPVLAPNDAGPETNEEAGVDESESKQEPVFSEGWDFVDPITSIYLEPNASEDNTYPVNIRFKIKKDGAEVVNYCDYTVTLGQTGIATIAGLDISEDGRTCSMQEGGFITLTPKAKGELPLVIREGNTHVATALLRISQNDPTPTKVLPIIFENDVDAKITDTIEVDNYPTYSYDQTGKEIVDNTKTKTGIYFILKDQYGNIWEKGKDYTRMDLTGPESFMKQLVEGDDFICFNGQGLETGDRTCKLVLTFTYPKSKSGTETVKKVLERTITMQINSPKVTIEANANYKLNEADKKNASKFVEDAYILRLNGKEILQFNAAKEKYGESIPEYYMIKYVEWTDEDKPSAIRYDIRYCNLKLEMKDQIFSDSDIPALTQTETGGETTQDNNQAAA